MRWAIFLVALFAWASANACGTSRWHVKVGEDADAGKVSLNAYRTTIARLASFKAPPHPSAKPNSRYPSELKTYSISGRLVFIEPEADQDYHLVVRDTAGRTMIVEAPEPACATKSRFLADIASVRATIDSFFGGPVLTKQVTNNVAMNIMGVGFFDSIHGQTGVAPNGIELHPILHISLRRL